MENRVAYPLHLNEIIIQMKQENTLLKTIMADLANKNKTQIETWRRRQRTGRISAWFNRLENSISRKRYRRSIKGTTALKIKINFLKM